MFKKLAMAVGVICLMGMLTACGRTSEQKVTEIRVAFNQNENHPQYRAMKAFGEKFEKETKYQWDLNEYLNRDICQPDGFDAYGYPRELFKLDMERLGIVPKRKPAKVIDFKAYVHRK